MYININEQKQIRMGMQVERVLIASIKPVGAEWKQQLFDIRGGLAH